MRQFKQYINNKKPYSNGYEEQIALVETTDNNRIIMSGCDHEGIEDNIDGFFMGLDYCNVEWHLEKREFITSDNPLFNRLNFSLE
jgi:hypothetical protein